MSVSSLTIFTQASKMLVEANTIQKAKELKNLALTAADWARRKGMGEEAVQYCRSYALDAERKMGEIYAASEKAKGTRGTARGRDISGSIQVVPPEREVPTLADLGVSKKTMSRAQKLAKLPQEKFEEVKQGVLKLHKVDKPHVSENAGENEWYTPIKFIEAARNSMESIDLDPASSEIANKTIEAKKYYSIKDNGLVQDWHGNIWLNPPYSQPEIAQFSKKLIDEYNNNKIKQACVLVNNATETTWLQNMMKIASVICFPKGRIKFVDIKGNPSGAPLQGQCILYVGERTEHFVLYFKKFGMMWKK